MPIPRSGQRLSRRNLMRLAGSAGASSALASVVGSSHSPAATAAQASATPLASSGPFEIFPTGVELPTEEVTFRWMVRGDGSKALFYKEFFPVYQQAHPNITIGYEGLPPAEITRILPLGMQNGTAPDCFEESDSIPYPLMVREGWVRPLDDLIPNFEQWKQGVPPGVLVEGVTVFEGKTYGFPYLSHKVYQALTLFNVEYMQQAGYDPSTTPLTWDDFRDATKKITEQGNGQYYGLILAGAQPGRWSAIVRNLAEMAGAAGGNINWSTGQYNYTSDEYLAAIELLLAIKDDGSVFPGSLQLTGVEERATFTQGAAGMILQGPWNIPVWNQENPDFNFGVGSQPIPTTGEPRPMTVVPGPWLPLWVYAESQHPEIAGDIFAYLASEEGQTALTIVTGGFPHALSTSAREKAIAAGAIDPRMSQVFSLSEEQLRIAPEPGARNPDVSQVYLEMKQLTPNLGQTIQGLFTGQLDDPKAALKDLQDRSEAELERAIKAAQDKGAQVSRDDWAFPNWDPTRDYTDADYAAL